MQNGSWFGEPVYSVTRESYVQLSLLLLLYIVFFKLFSKDKKNVRKYYVDFHVV